MRTPAHFTDPTGFVRDLWSTDGPHTPESITAAATAIEELTRYLAHATRSGSLDLPTVYALTGSFAHAARINEQVLSQVADVAAAFAVDPDLRHDSDPAGAGHAALSAVNELQDGAAAVDGLHRSLKQAQQHFGHLYLDGDDE